VQRPGAALLDIGSDVSLGRQVARKKSGARSPHSIKEMRNLFALGCRINLAGLNKEAIGLASRSDAGVLGNLHA